MIRTLASSFFGLRNPSKYYNPYPVETLNMIDLHVSDKVVVTSSFYAAGDETDGEIWARTSTNILDGDTLLLFISGSERAELPYGFKKVLSAEDKKETLNMQVGYKVWNASDPMAFNIRLQDETFVSLITLRGTRFIVDAKGKVCNSCGCGNEISTPRAYTAKQGAVISAFAYDEPHDISIQDQNTLASIEHGNRGLAIGISPTNGGLSKRLKAISKSKCGGGDDIAFCIALH
jgi:hypothetical protein